MDTNTCFIDIVVTRKPSQLDDGPPALQSAITVRLSEPSAPPTPPATKKTSQSFQILKRGPDQALLSVARPSDDPNKNNHYISVFTRKLETSLGERIGFDIYTDITEMRGPAWRRFINDLRAQYAFVSQEGERTTGGAQITDGEQSTDVFVVDLSLRPSMDPRLIREFLGSKTRSRSATWKHSCIPYSLVCSLSAFDTLTASDGLNTPLTFTVDISAPNDYYRLDFVDLALTLSNDFSSQSSGSDGSSNADLTFFFRWIAVNASHNDHLLENHLWAVKEFITSLISRYRTFHRVTDFQEGIGLLRSSIASCNPTITPICRDSLISDLVALLCEALSTTDYPVEQLEEMTRWCSENVIPQLPNSAAGINNFAQLYMSRYERSGELEDLQRNITILQIAINSPPPENSERAFVLFNVTRSLNTRYIVLGNPADLELALNYYQESLDMEASGVKLVPRWELLLGLGNTLRATDIDGAINALRESKELCPECEQRRYMILYNLAMALRDRSAARDGQLIEDAEESSSLEDEALQVASQTTGGLEKCEILIDHLRRELPALMKRASTPDDFSPYISKAMDAFKTVQTSPSSHIALYMLGMLYYRRYLVCEDAQDISIAHRYFLEALRIASAGSGYHNVAKISSWLASVHLQSKSEFFDIAKAYEYLEMCVDDTHCSAQVRLVFFTDCMDDVLSGKNNLSVMDLEPSKLSQLYTRALRNTFFEVTALEIDLKTGLDKLRKFGRLVARASPLCHESGQVIDAIKTFEDGRSIFWQQVFRTRLTPPTDVPPELKQRFQSLSQQVEQIRFNRAHSSLYPSPTLEYTHRKRTSMEYGSLIRELRKQSGSDTLSSSNLIDMHEVAEHGPIVMLVPHSTFIMIYLLYRTAYENPCSSILGHLKIAFMQSELQGYITRLDHANQSIRGETGRPSGSNIEKDEDQPVILSEGDNLQRNGELRAVRTRMRAIDSFNSVLKDLWLRIVKTILDKLGIKPSKGRDRPRLWWCPTGDFAFLPIHAAGDYSANGECCSDYVVSSYTPTITALATARRTYKPILKTDITALLAAVPHPFQGTPLPDTANELRQVARIIPQGQRVPLPPIDDVLVDPRAGLSVPTAIAKLPDATILHLASHGVQDFDNPLNSGFLLRDAKLSLEQLMPIPLPRAFLVFLSACETAKGDQRYIDQAIHLAATMLFAGFKSVIGTMWSMSDIDGPLVAGHIYDQIFSGEAEYLDPNVVPYALDEAVQRLRADRVPPSRWATFIHLGM